MADKKGKGDNQEQTAAEKKAEKAKLKEEKAAERKEKREARAKSRAIKKAAKRKAWNSPQTEDGQLLFLVNGILWFLFLGYVTGVAIFFSRH